MRRRAGGRQSGTKRGEAPDSGELVWLTFSPQVGREQAGRRPALVLSPRIYNSKSGLCLACPITSQVKGYPFEVLLSNDLPIQGVVLVDHVKSLDWLGRDIERVGLVSDELIDEIRSRLRPLLGM